MPISSFCGDSLNTILDKDSVVSVQASHDDKHVPSQWITLYGSIEAFKKDSATRVTFGADYVFVAIDGKFELIKARDGVIKSVPYDTLEKP